MSENIREVFSFNLKKYLKIQDKTQLELAKFVGVSDAAVNNWVNGYKLPRMDKVDKICKFLNIKRSDLLEERKSLMDLDTRGINRIAAQFEGDEFSEEDLDVIQNFINYVREKNKK